MNRQPGMGTLGLRWTLVAATVIVFLAAYPCFAEEYLEEFEGPATTWKVAARANEARIVAHQRRRDSGKFGAAEFVRVRSTRENASMTLDHSVPAATVLDELEASLWIKSNCDGLTLKVLVTFPGALDPTAKKPLTIVLTGDSYQQPGQWQQLKCRTADRAINDQIRQLRARKAITSSPKTLFVDRVILEGQLPPGETELFVDQLELTPLVRFRSREKAAVTDPIQLTSESAEEVSVPDPHAQLPVKFSMHRLQVGNKPFFPRIVAWHQEKPDVLAAAGINVAWISDYENINQTAVLRRNGIWVTATPPFAKGADNEPLDSEDASLLPFQANTSSVLFWMLGARMTADGRPRISSWTNQIRNADRQFNKRPIAADVVENERFCSRHVDLLGISRHVVHTNCSFANYRDWMIQRRDQAWPDTFCFTWIQTEPAPMVSDLARNLESKPMLEPEQIRLQVYAALAAGCRGLGFWATTPLDHDSLAARERLLTLTQLNLEIELFEPWLTSGGTPQLVSFKVDSPRNEQSVGKPAVKPAAGNARDSKSSVRRNERELQAALIRTEQGALLLPMWLEENAQFVPGPMAARNVSIIVPGGGETASAWEITTTGQLRYLEREPAAGGVQIKLPRFDQTAAVLITSKYSTVEEINQKIATIQERSARVSVELAKLKLERIRQVDQSLQSLGAERLDSWQWLGDAKLQLEKAEVALQSQQMAEARLYAGEALQYGRYLQRAHWDHAVRRLRAPTTSPWAVSFQSLPEHWKMMRRLQGQGTLDTHENLLPSGEFEDLSTLIAEHWKHEQELSDTVQSTADLVVEAKQGKRSLHLSARPIEGEAIPAIIPKAPVTIVSSPVSVQTGQIVRITGWAKVPAAFTASADGALIYDSLLGRSGAIHLTAAQDWQMFELLRPVPESQEISVTIALHGLGDLLVDDLRIAPIDPGPEDSSPSPSKSAVAPARYSPLRKLNPLQKR